MKKTVILIIIFYSIGHFSCRPIGSCDGVKFGPYLPYFDTKDFKASVYTFKIEKQNSGNYISDRKKLNEGDSVSLFNFRIYLEVSDEVVYAINTYSLFQSVNACSIPENGTTSKEIIDTLDVFTVFDYDSLHKAGAKINDILIIEKLTDISDTTRLVNFLRTTTTAIKYCSLRLNQKPDKFKVRYSLDNKEKWTLETNKVKFTAN